MNELAYQLAAFNPKGILIQAILEEKITALECAMPLCSCPEGRNFFEASQGRRKPWAPSADRYPIPGRFGGEYTTDNVRLAHWSCNQRDGARAGGRVKSENKKYTPEEKLQHSIRMTGTKKISWSNERRARQSLLLKDVPKSTSHPAWNKGLITPLEVRAKLSAAHKGKALSTSHRAAIAATRNHGPITWPHPMLGKPVPEERKAKIAASNRARRAANVKLT